MPFLSAINGLRTWVEIDTRAARKNYLVFRRLASGRRLMAVVKSNAYGHGLVQFSKLLERFGVDWLGVDSIVEGLALRRTGVKKPILVLGYTLPRRFKEASKHRLSLTVSTFENLQALKKYPVNFHLKLDTGMGRQGFLSADWPQALDFLKRNEAAGNRLEGVYTHFAAAATPACRAETELQIQKFRQGAALFERAGFTFIKHAAATAGALLFPEAHFDLLRVGIGFYGLWPSGEVKTACRRRFNLRPVLSWKTIVTEVKKLPAGQGIGYDFAETLTKPTVIAICPIGYWHGYPRSLSGLGSLLTKGRRAKILGRISMDITAANVSQIPRLKIGDTAVVLGRSGKREIRAEELARLAGTSPYEIITRINPLIKRVYR